MNKNSVAFIVSVVMLFGAYAYLSQRHANTTSSDDAQAPVSDGKSPIAEGTPTATPIAAAPSTTSTDESAPIGADFSTEGDVPEGALNTDDLSIKVGSKGGCVEGITLNNFQIAPASAEPVSLVEKLETCRALGFKLADADLRESPARLTAVSPTKIVIEQRKDGLHVRRTLGIGPKGYQGHLTIEVHNLREDKASGLLEVEIGATSAREGSTSFLSFDQSALRYLSYFAEGKRHETMLTFEKAPAAEVLVLEPAANIEWAASGGTYFMLGLSPNFKEPVGLRFERQPFNMQPDRQSPPERTIYEGWIQHRYAIDPKGSTSWSYDLYLGPKDLGHLQAAGHDLDEAINFGFFEIVAWPMFKLLKGIERFVGNWGIAIIILTLLIRLLFYPLTAKSYSASKKMQRLQPQLTELREKYKDDKAKQQQELMALMSKEGVNPLGGCLPVLPQIPVFFGLNAVLMHTFELRQAPLGLWIHDLSTHDPYYVSPVIMALLMFVQQKMTPMPGMDPAQAKIMRFLPIIFALFMITYPSGLVVYIVTSTIFSIAQQQVMMKTFKEA